MNNEVFGIDLGTVNSCIAMIDETGRAALIPNGDGSKLTPSVVNFASPGKVVVGQVAKDTAIIDPKNTISFVKTLMGRSDYAITYDGKDRTPEEVSAYILRKVVGDAETQIGRPIKNVVITCPAYFGTAEREATRNAGRIAGLNVVEVLNEPTAAAFYYGLTKSFEPKTVLVFDLGGGTFDVTVLKITGDSIRVVCSEGNHDLGGKNWDEKLAGTLARRFKESTGYVGEFDEYGRQALQDKAEQVKMALSARESVPVTLDVAGIRGRVEMTRHNFEDMTSALLREAVSLTKQCVRQAQDQGENVEEILLVGGSTKMPQVLRALEESFNLPLRVFEPDEAVAKGAALFGSALSVTLGGTANPAPASAPVVTLTLDGNSRPVRIYTATTKSYGLRVLVNKVPTCENLILKNKTIESGSYSVTKNFETVVDKQKSIRLVIFESDCSDDYSELNEELILGEAIMNLPLDEEGEGILPIGSPIQVTFSLSEEGILSVKAEDKTKGYTLETEMKVESVMTKKEFDDAKGNYDSTEVA